MEKTMTTQDKIRRAEEIYNRRKECQDKQGIARANTENKKDIKLLKKMCVQMIVCLAIYSSFYLIKSKNFIFSEDLINKSKEILTYDINFQELYLKSINFLKNYGDNVQEQKDNLESTDNLENIETKENSQTEIVKDGIGGAKEEIVNELSQMEQDALEIKKSISFINPVEGTITSAFGIRNPTTDTVSKYHTGLDIANKSGTKIFSATDGTVILASSEGDYRKSS